jgi:hypothetical protein
MSMTQSQDWYRGARHHSRVVHEKELGLISESLEWSNGPNLLARLGHSALVRRVARRPPYRKGQDTDRYTYSTRRSLFALTRRYALRLIRSRSSDGLLGSGERVTHRRLGREPRRQDG